MQLSKSEEELMNILWKKKKDFMKKEKKSNLKEQSEYLKM